MPAASRFDRPAARAMPSARAALSCLVPLAVLLAALAGAGAPRSALPEGGRPVLAADALLTTPVGGLENTNAAAEIVSVSGQPFAKALRVIVRGEAPETNATQLTLANAAPVEKGDALLASFYVRGRTADGRRPARLMFLFERGTAPWTKSVAEGAAAPAEAGTWRRVLVPFVATESYGPGQAMASLRFAFGPQTVEVGGLALESYGQTRTYDHLVALAAEASPLGDARVEVRLREPAQALLGFGGNFCQPRYGATEPMDPVGRYNLEHLRVAHARVGLPLERWTPEPGVYRDEAQARAALLLMRDLARRRIPITVSVWEGPIWMLGGRREQSGRTLPPERYGDCIEAVARFLVTARDRYQATADYFSFNEPDYGVNFRFTPEQMARFIRQAGPRFRALGLPTRFLVADTANGAAFSSYARTLLRDKAIASYLGPLAFHCWDALSASDAQYAEIAAVGRESGKPVWCTEAGHDAALWEKPNPWASWDNALRTALAYEKTLRLTGAALMDYWTYQDNYPLVSRDGTQPYPVFHVIRQMGEALPRGARVARTLPSGEDLRALASVGPAPGQFSVLLVNPTGAGRAELSGLTAGANVLVERSTADRQRAQETGGRVDSTGRLIVTIPARSVVSIVGVTPMPAR
ncbi:MAG: hypothetical protein IT208_16180 [Chthonomonadales bacterium]|nr:hypothetical protein [Chthonomonadales bacterium]